MYSSSAGGLQEADVRRTEPFGKPSGRLAGARCVYFSSFKHFSQILHGPHGPNGLSLGPAWPEKSKLPGPQGPKKVEIYKKSCDPGLNHEPQVVFYAEFEPGIGNGWNVDEHIQKKMKNRNFVIFIFDYKSIPGVPRGILRTPGGPGAYFSPPRVLISLFL